jgi:hypothetical protein
MKYLLFLLLLLALPSTAIAETPINYPANFIEWRGVVYNLNHLAGKGVQQIIAVQEQKPVEKAEKPFDANLQRVNTENARNLIKIELLNNMR